MKYLFRGENFGFTEDELHLQGGNSGFQKIALTDITKIKICNGFVTTNPILTFSFGLLLITIAISGVYWIIGELVFSDLSKLNMRSVRGYGAIIASIGLAIVLGKICFSLMLPNRIVLKVKLLNGSIEVRSLKVLERKNGLSPFLNFLTNNFSPHVLNIESKVLEKLGSR